MCLCYGRSHFCCAYADASAYVVVKTRIVKGPHSIFFHALEVVGTNAQ